MIDQILAALREFGFPVVCALLAGWAFWRATRDRIDKLESITRKQGEKIEELECDRLERAERYANFLRDLASKMKDVLKEHTDEMREWRKANRENYTVLSRLVSIIERQPCHYQKQPSSAELRPPPELPPQDVPTDTFSPTPIKPES